MPQENILHNNRDIADYFFFGKNETSNFSLQGVTKRK